MPNVNLELTGFAQGLASNVDDNDILPGAASSNANIDSSIFNKIAPLKQYSFQSSYGANIVNYDYYNKSLGVNNLVYVNTSNQVYYDPSLPATLSNAKDVTTGGGGIYIGTSSGDSKWLGFINFGQFGGSSYNNWYGSNANLRYDSSTIPFYLEVEQGTEDEDGYFQVGTLYDYAISVIYDGTNETTPLHRIYAGAEDTAKSDLLVKIYRLSTIALNPRVTGINLWVKEKDSGESYALAKSISINDTDWTTGTWPVGSISSNLYNYTDDGSTAYTYEQNTGIPETLEDPYVDYELSIISDSMLIAANCRKEGIAEAPYILFASKPYRYAMFEWTQDYVKLDEIPVAMVNYGGRLYVFGRNNMYRVNVSQMVVEDKLEGFGVIDQRAVIANDYGMFWISGNKVNMMSGLNTQPISLAIEDQFNKVGGNVGHRIGFDYSKNLVMVTTSAGHYAYNLPRQRWDALSSEAITSHSCYVNDAQNNLLFSTASGLYELFASSTYCGWTWETGWLPIEDKQIDKHFYKVATSGSAGGITVEAKTDSYGTWTVLSGSIIPAVVQKGKKVKLRFSHSASTTLYTLDYANLVLRYMKGVR